MGNKRILLIVSGGIAAYKALDLVRALRAQGAGVRAILTDAGSKFVTPLSLSALTGDKVYSDLFSLTDESEMGHIRLSREADLVLVVPATANILARMAQGLATDLATTALLATDKPVMVAPSMNVAMWENPATRDNMALLGERGVIIIGPNKGDLACGETGDGRMADVTEILDGVIGYFEASAPLKGRRALVTSGPTFEPVDPVRFIGNRSSGKQGHAIANALARLGAKTTLISGPVTEPDPNGVTVIRTETAEQMLNAVVATNTGDATLGPVDIAVMAAAVSDWRVKTPEAHKIKKAGGTPKIELVENPDILAMTCKPGNTRPALVIGFAAETKDVIDGGKAKRASKGCDWIVANDVSPDTGVFGGDNNTVHLITESGVENWPSMTKEAVAERLAEAITRHLSVPQ
ncbi:MAG: bifunctional phosphopantothenoylcysteine decarboxylase/phosphopantothenate--cysteine ligase CoaBC [Rhodospirillales bacterium]|nr:bifunctional phosphopantothenoylcysteine decarboxylase/phosphopantothenate--cysteine ligase CoaBC [Rhodospirillales bacterium]MBT5112246.1 bifunctional phosphopantothenoylcysteine decarboxylase/phosphopantothenate--cysteine ligase CoaBC [Rhodospirillales bacterium]MBT5671947.1 bifunctional phosphopantothenoylcysteine decarboxylase/phosphopantothenate--cysteine ligase CoaBC [Rhodospirillales bacterium]MBT6187213.1 bifunctional phosphopantothenoylcysteine decarboxylase/phosphopantothenate--cyst